MVHKRLLEIIACPICHNKLYYDSKIKELICKVDELAFPFHNGIPILLEDEARTLFLKDNKS